MTTIFLITGIDLVALIMVFGVMISVFAIITTSTEIELKETWMRGYQNAVDVMSESRSRESLTPPDTPSDTESESE